MEVLSSYCHLHYDFSVDNLAFEWNYTTIPTHYSILKHHGISRPDFIVIISLLAFNAWAII
jgi:hypothetical protein